MFTVLEKRTIEGRTKYHAVAVTATLAYAEAIRDAATTYVRFIIDAEGNPINFEL
jgi:hypothetical protein